MSKRVEQSELDRAVEVEVVVVDADNEDKVFDAQQQEPLLFAEVLCDQDGVVNLTEEIHLPDRIVELLDMLTYKRPHNSATEETFIERYIRPLCPHQDDFGNLWVVVGQNPEILWSCHTDTVHHEGGRQAIQLTYGNASLLDPKVGTCLGADDGAGIWLARQMILAGVPGLYIFHRGEECGGLGSTYIADHLADWLKDIRFAIALDRKGYTDVITHQGWRRCCSDAFAKSLGDALGMGFKPDDGGIFTDTANYVDIIGECTNLSVGYFSQHGPRESLDVLFLDDMLDSIIHADFSTLVEARKPGEIDDADWGWDGGYGSAYGGSNVRRFSDYKSKFDKPDRDTRDRRDWDDADWDAYLEEKYGDREDWPWTDKGDDGSYAASSEPRTVLEYVKENPDMVAMLLEEYGIGLEHLQDYEDKLFR